jgi:hypothetical protein
MVRSQPAEDQRSVHRVVRTKTTASEVARGVLSTAASVARSSSAGIEVPVDSGVRDEQRLRPVRPELGMGCGNRARAGGQRSWAPRIRCSGRCSSSAPSTAPRRPVTRQRKGHRRTASR